MPRLIHNLSLFLLGALGLCSISSAESFKDMATHVPDDANAIVLFNVEKILNSPIAQARGWRESHAKSFADGMVFLPPQAARCVMASNIDFEFFKPRWEVTLLDLASQSFSLQNLAQRCGGTVDQISGTSVVHLPTDKYAVRISPTRFGAMGPGERQAVARWIKFAGSTQRMSPYLQEAIGYSDRVGTEVIMALDVTDVFSAAEIDQRLGAMTALSRKRNVDFKAIGRTLASIEGITLGIVFGQKVSGKIKVDFRESAAPLAGHGKALLLEALSNHGAMIDDFHDWKPKTEANRISIQGPFTEDGLRKILSIFETPQVIRSVATGQGHVPAANLNPQDQKQKAANTQQYFTSVQKLLGAIRDKEPQRLSQYGVWLERYAQKIDNLPLVGVDKDMLDYGQYVAQAMRTASTVVKNRGIRTRAREVAAVNEGGYGIDYYYGVGGYNRWTGRGGRGYAQGKYIPSYNAYLVEQQTRRTQVRTQETANMATKVQQIKAEVQKATAHIRRIMAERYQINL